ncbi:MAG: type IV toxin-antitoxin system AbiEi family antitoxin domain-containing protein [Tissierellales bacterium]|nr:type IV toxin-antitoxin system AbiEi family antitoxin domain-containing protein [Tissierellales bacterium]
MDKIITFFKKHGGYARMKDLKAASFHTREVSRLLQKEIIEKVKPGLYRLADLPVEDNIPISFIDVCHAIPKGIVCLLSALEFHDLTTFNPSEIYIAIPNSERGTKIEYPPVRMYFFRNRFYNLGIETFVTSSGEVRIYNKEKTICDLFRYRNKLGEDVALEGLKNYLKSKHADIQKLTEYAEHCQVKTVLLPYIKALVAS